MANEDVVAQLKMLLVNHRNRMDDYLRIQGARDVGNQSGRDENERKSLRSFHVAVKMLVRANEAPADDDEDDLEQLAEYDLEHYVATEGDGSA